MSEKENGSDKPVYGPHNETKLQLTHRLHREDRTAAAAEFREADRARLRGEGMRKPQAREESWRLMADAFPPLDPAEVLGDRPPPQDDEETVTKRGELARHLMQLPEATTDLPADLAWVARHPRMLDATDGSSLGVGDADGAPSQLAVFMLRDALDDRPGFYKHIRQVMMETHKKELRDGRGDDGEYLIERKRLNELEAVIAEFEDA